METTNQQGEYRLLKLELLQPSPTNPRKTFNPEAITELAQSLAQHGILQPLVVRPAANGKHFEIVAGERRYRAALEAKLPEVPVIARKLSDAEVLEMQYIENLQRQDLTAMEEAEGFAALIKTGNYTPETLAEKLGKSRSHVFGRLRLTKISKAIRAAMDKGTIGAATAGLFAMIPDPKEQARALEGAKSWQSDTISFRGAKEYIAEHCVRTLRGVSFDLNAAELVPAAGPCTTCPKRVGNMPAFSDEAGGDPNACTDPACFKTKLDASLEMKRAAAQATGQRVLSKKEYDKAPYHTYQELDETCYEDSKRRKFRQFLPKDVKPIQVYEEDGDVKEVLPRADALALAKKAGVNFRSNHSHGPSKAERAKQLLEAKIARAVNTAVVQAAENPDLDWAAFWRVLARVLLHSSCHDSSKETMKRRQVEDHAAMRKAIASMDPGQCRGVVVELALCHGVRGTWGVRDAEKEILALFKVDKAKIAAQVKASAAEAKKPKAKPPLKKPEVAPPVVKRPSAAARRMTAAEKARIAASARARWARIKANKEHGVSK